MNERKMWDMNYVVWHDNICGCGDIYNCKSGYKPPEDYYCEIDRLTAEVERLKEENKLVRSDRDAAHKWCSTKLNNRYDDCSDWFTANMPDVAMPVKSWHIVKRLWVEAYKPALEQVADLQAKLSRYENGVEVEGAVYGGNLAIPYHQLPKLTKFQGQRVKILVIKEGE